MSQQRGDSLRQGIVLSKDNDTVYTGTCVTSTHVLAATRRFLPHVFKLNHVTPSWSLYNGNDDGKREPWTPSFIAARSRESTMIPLFAIIRRVPPPRRSRLIIHSGNYAKSYVFLRL